MKIFVLLHIQGGQNKSNQEPFSGILYINYVLTNQLLQFFREIVLRRFLPLQSNQNLGESSNG